MSAWSIWMKPATLRSYSTVLLSCLFSLSYLIASAWWSWSLEMLAARQPSARHVYRISERQAEEAGRRLRTSCRWLSLAPLPSNPNCIRNSPFPPSSHTYWDINIDPIHARARRLFRILAAPDHVLLHPCRCCFQHNITTSLST